MKKDENYQQKNYRYAIRKSCRGVASVAIAAVFLSFGTAVSADEEAVTNTSLTTASTTPTETTTTEKAEVTPTTESTTTSTPTTESPTNTPIAETTTESTTEENSVTPKSDDTVSSDEGNTGVTENKEDTTVAASTQASSPVPTPTETKDGEKQAVKNIQYEQYKNLYKNGDLPGSYGLYLTGKDKDGNDVSTTAFGASIVYKDLSDLNLRFVFKNGEQDTNVLFDVLLPNYDAQKNGTLVADADRIHKTTGIEIHSELGQDYSSKMTYSNIGHAGDYKNLQVYTAQQGGFSENLYGIYLNGASIKANDTVWFDVPMKVTNPTATTVDQQNPSVWDFRNWNRTFLNTRLVSSEQAEIPAKEVAKQPILAVGSEIQGTYWTYANDLMDKVGDKLPTSDQIFRFGLSSSQPEQGISATFVPDDKGGHYELRSVNEVLAKYNIAPSDYWFILLKGTNTPTATTDEKEKTNIQALISQYGYTVNNGGFNTGRYLYSFSNTGAVISDVPEANTPAAGVSNLYLQVIPALLLENKTYQVDATSNDWTVKDILTQFSDPTKTLVPIAKDAAGSLINDASKVQAISLKIVDEKGHEITDPATLKQKAGKYTVTASYNYGTAEKPWIISNTAEITVVTGDQQLVVRIQDDTDQKTLVTTTYSGKSNATVPASVEVAIKEAIQKYQGLGYKLVSQGAVPATFDDTANVSSEDVSPQYVDVHLEHDTEDELQYEDVVRTIHYQGAGEKTPADVITVVPNVFMRTVTKDKVNGNIVSVSHWIGSYSFNAVPTPEIDGYVADKAEAGGGTVTGEHPTLMDVVTYKKKEITPAPKPSTPEVPEQPITPTPVPNQHQESSMKDNKQGLEEERNENLPIKAAAVEKAAMLPTTGTTSTVVTNALAMFALAGSALSIFSRKKKKNNP